MKIRLNVKKLDDRIMPDAVPIGAGVAPPAPGTDTWLPTAAQSDGSLWIDPNNWSLGRVPLAGDGVVFPAKGAVCIVGAGVNPTREIDHFPGLFLGREFDRSHFVWNS